MKHKIHGLHHITAIAGDAQRSFSFYTEILGLRFIKKTVNFDNPHTYHFYFGNDIGSAGNILTFFQWGNSIVSGRRGSGMVTEIGYSVPKGSLDFWMERFEKYKIVYTKPAEKFGERYLTFLDPDGLKFEFIETDDARKPWITEEVTTENAIRGFHNITITLNDINGTANILKSIFGYELVSKKANRFRYMVDTVESSSIVDLVELPHEKRGHVAKGTIHHVAFGVIDDKILMYFRNKVENSGIYIAPEIDRDYFQSVCFREPGGVLFEIATDNPGFIVDESIEELGENSKLPIQYESHRIEIEAHLVNLN